MDRLVEAFARSTSDLKVYQRTAANIKEQLLTISKNQDDPESDAMQALCSSLRATNRKLQAISGLLPLQSYLRQREVSDLLDFLLEECWKYAQASDDDFLREDIETQRIIYKSDYEADKVNVKRLLRDSLRRNDAQQQLLLLNPHDTAALQSAISLELRSFVDQGSNSQTVRLYKDILINLDPGSRRTQASIGVQDLTGRIGRISSHPIAWGAVCAVLHGELYGKRVSLQSPSVYALQRLEYSEDDVLKNAMTWASFDHPNILPLLGFSKDIDGHRLALVSPWMKNQNIENFSRMRPEVDRLKLVEMACGLCYLHGRSPPYVHGLLTGSKAGVLVNEDGQAVIGGFASAAFQKGIMCSLRWLAPEAIKGAYTTLTTASDVYSFAMTVLQVITGAIPFHDIRSPVRVVELMEKGERPARPDGRLVHHGIDDRLWLLISRCWAQNPKDRPPMDEVHRELKRMQELPVLDVRDLSGLITLGDDDTDIRACGAFGDIRVGILKDVGPVALKTLNIKGRTQPVLRHTKRFFREASIWNKLRHPNVLPFLGTADPPGLSTCLVSPWMENGNLIEFMRGHKDEPLLHVARGISQGLAYLHAHEPHPVIHGDLRGANVLISATGEPLLCDFGLAIIIEDLTQMPISSILQDAGNPRWMAPELFVGEQHVSTATDVWALGMVVLEIMSNDIPYSDLKNSAQVIVQVHKGCLPSRPSGEDAVRRGMSDELWDLMMKCWTREASSRPSAAEALRAIKLLVSDVAL